MAGLPASVCEAANQLSQTVDFDPIDEPSDRAKGVEIYHHIYEQLVYIRAGSTMDPDSLTKYLSGMQRELRSKILSSSERPTVASSLDAAELVPKSPSRQNEPAEVKTVAMASCSRVRTRLHEDESEEASRPVPADATPVEDQSSAAGALLFLSTGCES